MDDLIWKDIKGFEGIYQISNYGDIKSLARKMFNTKNEIKRASLKDKILAKRKNKKGYIQYILYKNSIKYNLFAHRLVYENFIGEISENLHINHLDSNKINNYYKNLEVCTNLENQCHLSLFSGKIPGVTFLPKINKWRARIEHNKKDIHIGTYSLKEDAIKARLNYQENNNISNKYFNNYNYGN